MHPRLASRLSSSRCFRTTPDGRIPLRCDWPALFEALRRLPLVTVQTRHAAARLIATGPLPAFAWDGDEAALAADTNGTLELHCAEWAQAWGRLEVCDCCDSPGRIDILNKGGADFLQFRGGTDCTLTAWSEIIATLAPEGEAPDAVPSRGGPWLHLLSEDVLPLAASPEALAPLLAALGNEAIPVRCTLTTSEALHERVFRPRHVTVASEILTVHEPGITCQLALPAVRGLAVETLPGGPVLHAVGTGGTRLLTFSSAAPAGVAWNAALTAAFPELA